MELAVALLGVFAAAVVALNVWGYRTARDGRWHDHSGFRRVKTIDGKNVWTLAIRRRLGPDGKWQYREKSAREIEDDVLHQSI